MVLRKVLAKSPLEFGFAGLGPWAGQDGSAKDATVVPPAKPLNVPKVHLERLRDRKARNERKAVSESPVPTAPGDDLAGLELKISRPPEGVPPAESWKEWLGNHPGVVGRNASSSGKGSDPDDTLSTSIYLPVGPKCTPSIISDDQSFSCDP